MRGRKTILLNTVQLQRNEKIVHDKLWHFLWIWVIVWAQPYLSVTGAAMCSQPTAHCQKGQCRSRITNVNLTIRISDLSVVAVTMLQTCGSESSSHSAVCSAVCKELRPALIWKYQEFLRWDPGCIIHHTGIWPLGSVPTPPHGFHLLCQSAGQPLISLL